MVSNDGCVQTNFQLFNGAGLNERLMVVHDGTFVHLMVRGPTTNDMLPERMMALKNADRLEVALAILGKGGSIDVVLDGELAKLQRERDAAREANDGQ